MSEILIPPLFRMLAKAFQALEHEIANHVERIEVLEAEKREGKAYIEKLRGELEAAKTKAQLGAEECDLLEAALALDRHVSSYSKEGISPSAQSISLELDTLHAAAVAFRNTGRSL